jgi:hypothetical protein
VIEGGCFCGQVRFCAVAPPTVSMICHCRSCRRAGGAPTVPWITFAKAEFAVTAGELTYFVSSPPVRRGFCGACGTPLTYEHEERPDEIDVTTASLDDPEAFPPTYHAWLEDDLAWVRLGDGLPAYPRWRPGEG